jgi:predicted amidohydrolase
MTGFATLRVAAIQATHVILDDEGRAARAERLLHEAADEG